MTLANIHVFLFSENLSLIILQVELQSALHCASAETDVFVFWLYSTILIIGERKGLFLKLSLELLHEFFFSRFMDWWILHIYVLCQH